jgi:hypothetical protein
MNAPLIAHQNVVGARRSRETARIEDLTVRELSNCLPGIRSAFLGSPVPITSYLAAQVYFATTAQPQSHTSVTESMRPARSLAR